LLLELPFLTMYMVDMLDMVVMVDMGAEIRCRRTKKRTKTA
jgi:dephospho-CoA kinase